ncbi:MAG: hypothetical protein ACK400_14480, partial [Pseudanabaena sp.]
TKTPRAVGPPAPPPLASWVLAFPNASDRIAPKPCIQVQANSSNLLKWVEFLQSVSTDFSF